VVVLNFFAEHARQSFTLTEVAKSLKLSRATTHGVLGSLVEAGYLYRSSDKVYMLGPALASIARNVLDSYSPLQAARPEMRDLADTYDAVCTAIFREGDEAVIRERAASVSHLGWNMPHQLRTPIVPPFGAVFVAWSSSGEIAAWLDRAAGPLVPGMREDLESNLSFLREHGYTFGYRKAPLVSEERARQLLGNFALTNYVVGSLDPERDYDLAYVVAPVFDEFRRVAFALATAGFVRPAKGRDVAAIGRDLRDRCDRIGYFIKGRSIPPPGLALESQA
jgi:DNA-binding IclR family transcriptional regulator